LPPIGLTEREALLSETERAANLGTWVWDVRTNAVTWSRELFKILGYDPDRDAPTSEAFFAALHPDDVARVRGASEQNAVSGYSQAEECRVRRGSGDIRDILIDGTSIRDESGASSAR
jgi:two-component system, cell cycle sensor histidine kinase and response regulator CckA